MLNNSILEFLISLLNSEDTDIYKRIKEIEPLSHIKEDFGICLKEVLGNKLDLLIGLIQSNFDSEFPSEERNLILSTLKNDM